MTDLDLDDSWCSVVPDEFLHALVEDEHLKPEVRDLATDTLDAGQTLQATPISASLAPAKRKSKERIGTTFGEFNIYDAENGRKIPGTFRVDEESFIPTNDIQVDVLYHWLRKIHRFFVNAFNYKLFDGKGNPIHISIHYGEKCMNAYWKNGQVVLGDGDTLGLYDFWKADDIITHEITHGIIAHTSGLKNRDETGALNEHLADVCAILYKQRQQSRDRDAGSSTWILGEKLFVASNPENPKPSSAPADFPKSTQYVLPTDEKTSVLGYAVVADPTRPYSTHWHNPYLRNFEAPESSNPPQPRHWKDRKTVKYDRGGVHQNSGIPNFAFYTAAVAAGGPAWSGVGQVWFRAMVDVNLGVECTFARFAALTLQYAADVNDGSLVEPIRKGWDKVGIVPKL